MRAVFPWISLAKIVKLETIVDVFEEKYLKKIGKEKTDKNIQAINFAFDSHLN